MLWSICNDPFSLLEPLGNLCHSPIDVIWLSCFQEKNHLLFTSVLICLRESAITWCQQDHEPKNTQALQTHSST